MASRFVVQDKNDGAAINNLADRVNQGESNANLATGAAGVTLTAVQTINGVYSLTGGTTATLTTPTAAVLVAALKNAEVGSSFTFSITNANSGNATMAGGTGVTVVGSATVANGTSGTYRAVVTNATGGAEAISLLRI